MIKRFDDFILEKFGFPDILKYYADEIYDYCADELDMYLSRSTPWRSYTKYFDLEFNENPPNEFIIKTVKIKFCMSVSTENIHQSFEGGFDPDDDDGVFNLEVKIKLNSSKKSVDPNLIKEEIMQLIRHELVHAYEEYHLSKKDKTGFYSLGELTKYNKYGYNIYFFIYQIYFCQAGEINAHIGQLSEHSDDVKHTIDSLINFDYKERYKDIYNDIIESGHKLSYLDKIVEEFIDDYREYCLEFGDEPYEKMLRLQDKSFLDFMKYWQPIFHKVGKRALRKYWKRIKY